jgi:arylamine N-acetyltransferase
MINSELQAENIILDTFKNEPFHTLFFLYDIKPLNVFEGGTCSDKVLSARSHFEKAGFSVRLHSSIIDNKECHRLLKLTINKREYFADVGNGWPSIKLFPAFRDHEYHCFGITFYSRVFKDHVKIYQKRDDQKRHTVTVPFDSMPEEEILQNISNRFDQTYPFTGKQRFAQVVKNRFLFLRDTDLHIYSDDGKTITSGVTSELLSKTLLNEFNFNLEDFLFKYKK